VTVTLESIYEHLVPSWLSEGEGGKVLTALARLYDENIARWRAGLNARFPSRTDEACLAVIGRDRLIVRGRTESAANYATRLVAWRYPRGHRVRGNPFALLEQIVKYWGDVFAAYTAEKNGDVCRREIEGTESFAQDVAFEWDLRPDAEWSRFWVVLESAGTFTAQLDWGDAGLWGGDFFHAGYTIGQQGAGVEDVRAMRRLMTGHAWRPSGTQPEWICVQIDTGATMGPDGGAYQYWSKDVAGVRMRARDPRFRYWSLAPAWNNTYAGRPEVWSTTATMLDDSVFAPNADRGGTWLLDGGYVLMPDGTHYVPNPNNFPSGVRLCDDGDSPESPTP
jgi:hypothetical protein